MLCRLDSVVSLTGSQVEAQFSRWRSCTLSQEPLAAPVVCDDMGNLYNKTALIEALIAKTLPPLLCHVRGLKDVFTVMLKAKEDEGADESASIFECPVTLLPANGRARYVCAYVSVVVSIMIDQLILRVICVDHMCVS
jgi:hypothetical protein